ncbi:MAG: SUMF1/EgtB/PvdO family nonheme iron enzyme [bacterium]
MKHYCWWIKTLVVICILFGCQLASSMAAVTIDVEMRLNDGGFVSYDHFQADLYLNNLGRMVSDASIFGILEVMGEFFFWPSFSSEVDFELMDIKPGETVVTILAFDFGDIEDFIPFGPMVFWGAWFLDMETWNYDSQEFWLGPEHKWTPTPTPTPTSTPASTIIVSEMVFIPPGTYMRGSPDDEPCRFANEIRRQISLTRGFYMMQTEVTRRMWADLKSVQPDLPDDPSATAFSPTMDHPVQNVTWFDAVLFANLMSLQEGYRQCYYLDQVFMTPLDATNYTSNSVYCDFNANGYRLPTDAEWEYACRAGSVGPFSCSDPDFTDLTCQSCVPGTHPELERHCVYCANNWNGPEVVGSKYPNMWGLYDMHGNVFEWCWDWYTVNPSRPFVDPTGPETGIHRVERGGSWSVYAQNCRSAIRSKNTPYNRDNNRGFRLVRSATGFIYIPGGTYTQGSPDDEPCRQSDEDQYHVTLTCGFDMMVTEATRQMWADLKHFLSSFPEDPSDTSISPSMIHPVQNVTWNEAVLFANILSIKRRFVPCYYADAEFTDAINLNNYTSDTIFCNFDANGYRLPTEAEWEYACRAGTVWPFTCYEPKYNTRNCETCEEETHRTLEQYCVYCAAGQTGASVVGSKNANQWGFYDMHGNVNEWCWDRYGSYPSGSVTDPTGPETGSNRVARGGSWNCSARSCRSANRNSIAPDSRSHLLGFRLVRKPMELTHISSGDFNQGPSWYLEPCRDSSLEIGRHVTLTRDFEIMLTEVTRQMWADLKAVCPMLPNDPSDETVSPTMDHPVQNVTWNEAVLFANLMSAKDGYRQCYYKDAYFTLVLSVTNYNERFFFCDFEADGYRLPTEAEWEYVCRAGTTGAFSCDEPYYDSYNCESCDPGTLLDLEQYCVFCANSSNGAELVGSKLPNPWELYDMHGNVSEWCWDCFEKYPSKPVVDPTGGPQPCPLDSRIERGGSWDHPAKFCRTASRSFSNSRTRKNYRGFRLVKTVFR